VRDGTRAWLWSLLRPHRRQIGVGVAAVLVLTAADLALPYLFKIAIDGAVVARERTVLDLVAAACLGLVGVKVFARRLRARTVARVGQRTLDTVRRTLFAHLLQLPLEFYQRERTGGIVARMTGDVDATSGLVSSALLELVSSVVTFAGVAAVLAVLDWRLALATLTLAPVLAGTVGWFRSRSGSAWGEVRQTASAVATALQEAISGVREIQAYRREATVLRNLATVHDDARRAGRRTAVQGALFFPGVELISGLATAVVLGYGGHRVLAGQLGIGTLTAFVLYLRVLFGPVFNLSERYDTVQAAMAAAERIGRMLASRPTVGERDFPLALPCPRGHLRLARVRFAYPDPDGGPGAELLHDVDLDVPAGATVALVGATGAGRSTIARLILRFHDPSAGHVVLDGLDLRDLRLDDLRRAIGFVPCDGFLFAGTVADNIRFGRPDAGPDQIARAIAALGVGPLIDRLPAGLDTPVGARGDRLASGERQVIAFLRAWVADPAVLVLEEATSHLDADTERCLQHALRELRRTRTTVFIAHRLSSVLDADRVAVVDDGRIVEAGPPAALIAADGPFADLYRSWVAATPPAAQRVG
jgi:ATP-binding cassette subfamily B protein